MNENELNSCPHTRSHRSQLEPPAGLVTGCPHGSLQPKWEEETAGPASLLLPAEGPEQPGNLAPAVSWGYSVMKLISICQLFN